MSERERASKLRALCDDILNGKRFAFGVFITNAAERECIFIVIVSIFGLAKRVAVARASETGRCGANVAD